MSAYDQFILFGDSLLQLSLDQQHGFAFTAQLAHGTSDELLTDPPPSLPPRTSIRCCPRPLIGFPDYVRKLDVVNRGFNGYTSAQALRILPGVVPPPGVARVRVLLVLFGANDACPPGYLTGQHVPLAQYGENLKAMVRHEAVRAQPGMKVLLVTPPPIDEWRVHDRGASWTAATTRQYAQRCRDVAEELDVPVLDLWGIFMRQCGWQEGSGLVGDLKVPENPTLGELLSDGALGFTKRLIGSRSMLTINQVRISARRDKSSSTSRSSC
nr:gdsl esterase/lipase [Quercus suber]